MDKFYDLLKKCIDEHQPDFGDGESILTLLYEAYSEYNRMEDAKIKVDFEELYRLMNGMSLREMDKTIYSVCSLSITIESVTIGSVGNSVYAFVALERIGGIMVYDITDPANASYVNYINTRDFSENPEDANPEENPEFYLTGDVAPEGLYFINTPDTAVLLAAYEVSGTVSAYAVGDAVDHNFVDGICAKCSEAVIVDVTEPADAIEVPETTAPSIEEKPQNSGSNVVWVVIAAVIAVVLITVFVRKHQKS